MKIEEQIVNVAEDFIGLVEIVSNKKWDDLKTKGPDESADRLRKMLIRSGHQDGWAYCMSFAEGVWHTAYEDAGASPELIKKITTLLNPSVMSSFNACNEAKLISKTPVAGAIMFLQNGKGGTGHAGVVTSVSGDTFQTIEANTSPSKSDLNERDGGAGTGGVWRKSRSIDFTPKSKGLWLRGFLNPLPIASK